MVGNSRKRSRSNSAKIKNGKFSEGVYEYTRQALLFSRLLSCPARNRNSCYCSCKIKLIWEKNQLFINVVLVKVMANDDTMLRTHCCS